MKKIVAFAMLLLFLVMAAPAECKSKYENSNWNNTSKIMYKGWPEDWWTTYIIKEFDKIVPAPGADWLYTTQRVNLTDWLSTAQKKGWKISTVANQAREGAIAIRQQPDDRRASLYIVREVHDWGFVGSSISKDGEPITVNVYYSALLSNEGGWMFKGYIYPEKVKK